MHRMYCGMRRMPKGICQAETMSNSEKIKFVSLAPIELCLSEGISQSVTVQNQSQYKIPLNIYIF